MQHTLTIIASLVVIASGIPYILDTIKGKTKPNIVTWFTWSLLNGINVAATLSDGALQTALFSAGAMLVTSSITVLGLRQGIKKYTLFDAVCQVLALLGIVLWQLTNQPALAVVLVVLADFIAGAPTVRHAFKAPHEETLKTFVMSIVAGALFLASLNQHTLIAVAFPLYILLFDLGLVVIIILRRAKQRQANLKAV